MAEEFVIKSELLEDKINQLLPSQGGAGAGVDLSASTMIVPVVNLTEAAEGSVLRQDLQSSFSLTSNTSTSTSGTTTNLITTTGYFRIFGSVNMLGVSNGRIEITDGTTTKKLFELNTAGSALVTAFPIDFIVFSKAGDTVRAISLNANCIIGLTTRQIADISGNLVNPT